MQIFLQYCYSAILNIELYCSKYCKKIIIFYLTLSPLSLSLISISPSLNPKPTLRRNSHPAPYEANPKTETATRNPAPQSTTNPAPYHAIEHGETNTAPPYHEFAIHGSQPSSTAKPTRRRHITNSQSMDHNHGARWNPPDHNHRAQWNPYHEFAIHDPRSTTRAVRVRVRHGTNEVLGLIEAELWNLGFFVCGFCWLMRFWLIYEVLGVWVYGLLVDHFTTLSEMKASAEESWKWDGRGWKVRETREMERKVIILRYIILLCRYIILMSKRGK